MTDVKLPPLPEKFLHDTAPIWSAITAWEMSLPGKESEASAKVIDDAITVAMQAYARAAVLQERERCAKVCEELAASGFSATPSELHMWNCAKQDCADAIRKGE